MFARNNFHMTPPKGQSALVVPLLPVLHDDPGQSVQGGAVGEHYHITLEELNFLQSQISIGNRIYEPVMAGGELCITGAGDCMMAFGGNYVA